MQSIQHSHFTAAQDILQPPALKPSVAVSPTATLTPASPKDGTCPQDSESPLGPTLPSHAPPQSMASRSGQPPTPTGSGSSVQPAWIINKASVEDRKRRPTQGSDVGGSSGSDAFASKKPRSEPSSATTLPDKENVCKEEKNLTGQLPSTHEKNQVCLSQSSLSSDPSPRVSDGYTSDNEKFGTPPSSPSSPLKATQSSLSPTSASSADSSAQPTSSVNQNTAGSPTGSGTSASDVMPEKATSSNTGSELAGGQRVGSSNGVQSPEGNNDTHPDLKKEDTSKRLDSAVVSNDVKSDKCDPLSTHEDAKQNKQVSSDSLRNSPPMFQQEDTNNSAAADKPPKSSSSGHLSSESGESHVKGDEIYKGDKPGEKKEDKPEEKKEDKPKEKKEDKPEGNKEDKPVENKEDKPGENKEDKPEENKEDKPGENKEDKPGKKKGDKPGKKKGDKPGEKKEDKPEEKKATSYADKTRINEVGDNNEYYNQKFNC